MRLNSIVTLTVLLLVLLPGPGVMAAGAGNSEARIAIVIDDLGNLYAEGLRTLELPGPVSFAILPFTPYSQKLARLAHNLGRDVLVHLPMQAHGHNNLGPGALYAGMSRDQLAQQVRAALRAVPFARGLSNHMGSMLTEQRQPMTWLMQTLKQEHKLFFLDSRTTALTQAAHAAQASHLPNTSRDVFLDNEIDEAAIGRQFDVLLEKARLNGTAVAIGHPHPQTLKVLESRLPALRAQGIRLVSLSRIIQLRRQQQGPVTPPRPDLLAHNKP